jgi:hypothetical protein
MLFVGYAEVKANGVPNVHFFANLQKPSIGGAWDQMEFLPVTGPGYDTHANATKMFPFL